VSAGWWRRLTLAAAAVTALGLTRPDRLPAQISPGALAAPHEPLEGSLQCTACHGKGGEAAMTGQCLACHKDVAWLRERGLGLHARDGRERCASCHPDHAGRDFRMVTWAEGDSTRFDHRRTGWALDGRHRETACLDCHTAKFRRSPAAALSPGRRSGGWLGLDRSCATCHDDVHRGALADNCLKCHDTRDWKPAPGFDHDSTDYPLTGKHASVRCDACHLSQRVVVHRTVASQPIPVYRPVPHSECSTCHRDPHAGGLGASCGRCHTTAAFSTVTRGAFDHDRTRYPLRGKHTAVACDGCHNFRTARGKRPPFATCSACHTDAHAGSATLAGRPADCADCHDVNGFTPSPFTVARHRDTRYPLEGRHAAVACSGCHRKDPAGVPRSRLGTSRVLLRPPAARCRDCHGDDHGPQLAAARDCRDCHAVSGWTPSTFGVKAHADTRLQLDGRHAEITCGACHGPERPGLRPLPPAAGLGRARIALSLAERSCSDCHVDPHAGRFSAGGARAAAGGCGDCHDTRHFRPSTVEVTAHERLGFPLDGGHRAVPCLACHDDLGRPPLASSLVAGPARDRRITLTRSSRTCSACHADPHDGQFAARTSGAGCEGCHGVEAFRPATGFDHDRDTPFALQGAHSKVACLACHTGRRSVAGRSVVVYAPLSSRCESCHAGRRRAS
jgi:cytochrome c7-like protein